MQESIKALEEDEACPAIGYQSATICAPVKITPYVKPLPTTTKCCGDPIVIPGDDICEGVLNGSCSFIISQTICIAVPIGFGATSSVGDPHVSCIESSNKDICSNCTASILSQELLSEDILP